MDILNLLEKVISKMILDTLDLVCPCD